MNLLTKGVLVTAASVLTFFAVTFYMGNSEQASSVSAQSVNSTQGKSCGQCTGGCTASKNGCSKCGAQNGGVCGCSKK